jgi:hypothetical protein
MHSVIVRLCVLALLTAGCAGRDPQQIQTVMAHDASSNCQMIQAEINANNMKVQELADEKGMKVAQNVAAGVWPLWFAMDFKGAADKDVVALQARQQYLTSLAVERCRPPRRG